MLDLKGLWMCDASNTFKLEDARTDKGSKEAWLSFIQREIGMRTNLVILGRPPGRALFNVKSRTLRVLTMVSCWWRLNVVTMAIPLIFFLLFLWSEEQEPTPFSNQDNELAREERTWGIHIPPPHLEFAKLQVYGVQVSFCSCSSIKTYRSVVVGVAHMFVGVVCPSFSLTFP